MNFKNDRLIERSGEIAGFAFAYIFSTVLIYAIPAILNKFLLLLEYILRKDITIAYARWDFRVVALVTMAVTLFALALRRMMR